MRPIAAGVWCLFLPLIAAAAAGQDRSFPDKPRHPNAGRAIALTEALRISDQGSDFFLKSPGQVGPAPDGGLVVLDDSQILWFDASGRLRKNLYRGGQGPGEFQRALIFVFLGNDIVVFQRSPAKFVRMDADGTLLGDVKPGEPVTDLLGVDDGRFLVTRQAFPPLDRISKEEGDFLNVDYGLRFVDAEGRVADLGVSFPVRWFARPLKGALIADSVTPLLGAPLGDGLAAISHERDYRIKIVDLSSHTIARTIGRAYRSVKAAPPAPEPEGGPRRLRFPRDYHNDIQKLFAVDGRIWAMTSTIEAGRGALVDVFDPDGGWLDSFHLPLPRGLDIAGLARHPMAVAGGFVYTVELKDDGTPEVVKFRIDDPVAAAAAAPRVESR